MDQAPTPDWRTDPPPSPAAARAAGPRKAFVGLLAFLALATATAGVVSWARPRPAAAFVPLLLNDADPVPEIAAFGKSASLNPPDNLVSATTAGLHARIDDIEALPKDRAAIVFVSGAATTDPAGNVILWPTAAGGVPLHDILDRLKQVAGKKKLLILDLGRLPDAAADRLAAGLVPGKLAAELDAVPDPDRLTLAACGPGQEPLFADEFGRTAFGFYLSEGLRGWAAPPGESTVTAKALAGFVTARVRRLAEQTRGLKQTPTLYGDGPDFPLTQLRGGKPQEPTPLPDAKDYPTWLKEGWAAFDKARPAEPRDPAAVRAFERILLNAELAWRRGEPATKLPDDVTRLVARLAKPLPDAAAIRPSNLVSTADPADLATIELVRSTLRAAATAKPEDAEKLVFEAADKLRAKPSGTAARAVLEAAADMAAVTPADVRRIDLLVRNLDPRPHAVETAFLANLLEASRTAGPGVWDPAAAALAFTVLRDGERATTAVAFPAVKPLLDAAARDRREGEVRLFAPGYAPPAAAGEFLQRAADAYRRASRVQQAVAAADAELLRANALLTGTAQFQLADPADVDRWSILANAAAAVAEQRRTNPLGPELEDATRRLTDRLNAAADAFRPEKLAAPSDPTAADVRRFAAVLSTPLLLADQRPKAWAAYLASARKLAERVRDADAEDGRPPAVEPPTFRGEWDADRSAERTRRAVETRSELKLAALAGRPIPAALKTLPDEVDDEPAARSELAEALRTAAPNTTRTVPTEAESPAVRLLVRDAAAFRTWLADSYELAAADPGADRLFASAAADLRLTDRTPSRPPPRPTGPSNGVLLTPKLRDATFPLRIELTGGDRPDEVSIAAAAADWLTTVVDTAIPAFDRPALDVGLRIGLAGTAESTPSAPPRGVLVRVRTGGRSTFLKVPVDLTAVRDRLEATWSQDATPGSGTDRLALRPGGPAARYLHLRNPGDRVRTLGVELAGGGRVLTAAVTLLPGGSTVVRFPPPAKPEPADDLTGPLVLRITDTDRGGAVALRREFKPEVVSPATYIELVTARLIPPSTVTSNRNRVEVVLKSNGVVGRAVKAELVILAFDPARPGPLPGGTLRGEVPLKEGELRLFAESVTPGPDGRVRFALTLDGVERAYFFDAAMPPDRTPVIAPPVRGVRFDLVAPPAAPTGKFPVRIVADNAPPDATVKLALGRLTASGLEADVTQTYPSSRRQKVTWLPAPDGGLIFDGTTTDWVADLDVAAIRGRRVVLAQLLNAANEQIRSATAGVLLDDRPPDFAAFADLPAQAQLGAKLPVRVVARAGAGVKDVKFFVGKLVEGKPPTTAVFVAGKPVNADLAEWTADLPLPRDKPGTVDLTAIVTTAAGLVTPVAGAVELVPYDPAKVAPGIIRGVLREGQVGQVGAEVVLRDEKGTELAKTKSLAGGAYKFEAVPPGSYKVTARKFVSGATKAAAATAKVPPKAEVTADLNLYLTGK